MTRLTNSPSDEPTFCLPKLTYFRGRVALYSILQALGIGSGDEVATQAFTCLAVPEGIMATGARPLFIDITGDGFNLDARDLEQKLDARTKAIVVQHTFGIPADIQRILKVAEKWGLPVIEDCCHTLASKIDGQRVGTFGAAAFYSYEWGKPIVAGLGGSATANHPELFERLEKEHQSLGNPGLLPQLKLEAQYLAYWALYRPQWYWTLRRLFHRSSKIGLAKGNYNAIPEEGNGASHDFRWGMAPRFRRRLFRALGHVEQHASHARQVVEQYQAGVDSPHVTHPLINDGDEAVFARYPLRVPDKPRLLANASQQGIELAEWYNTPIHPLTQRNAEQVNYQADSCPHAEQRAAEVVSLPTHRRVTRRYIGRAVELLQEAA